MENLKMIKKLIFISFAIITLSLNVFPQERVEKKEQVVPIHHEIVVTATRIETPTKEIASSVTVITSQDLRRMKKNTVLEALQDVLGVTVIQNGPSGGAAYAFLRGANSEHTLVMIDGVELNDPIAPTRSYDLAHFSLDNVSRIEVLRGPQSTLYGSDAIGGVINIITKKGQGKPSRTLNGYSGSYGTYSGSAGISGSTKKINYSLEASYFQSKGLSAASSSYEGNEEKDGYQNLTLAGRFLFSPADNLDFDFSFRKIRSKSDVDNFAGAYGDDPNHTQKYDGLFLRGGIRTLFLKNRWEQLLNISLVDHNRKHQNPIDESHPFDSEEAEYKSQLLKIDWQNNIFIHENNTMTFGFNFQQEQGESEYLSDGFWGPFSSIFPLQKARTTSLYIQNQARIANKFFATMGARIDDHSQFGTSLTYRLAPAFLIEKTGTKIKTTLGTGFKSPSLYQLYAPGTFFGPIGNEYLKPEKSIGWDVGIEQQLLKGKILLGATYFYIDYNNLIDFDFTLGYINVVSARSKGLELLFRTQFTKDILLSTNYTRTLAKDLKSGDSLLRRPKDKFSASLGWKFIEKFHTNLSFTYVGKREDIAFVDWSLSRVAMSSYVLLNAVISYDMAPNAQVFLRFDNILDEAYELVKGFGTPGFSAFGGLKLQF